MGCNITWFLLLVALFIVPDDGMAYIDDGGNILKSRSLQHRDDRTIHVSALSSPLISSC